MKVAKERKEKKFKYNIKERKMKQSKQKQYRCRFLTNEITVVKMEFWVASRYQLTCWNTIDHPAKRRKNALMALLFRAVNNGILHIAKNFLSEVKHFHGNNLMQAQNFMNFDTAKLNIFTGVIMKPFSF